MDNKNLISILIPSSIVPSHPSTSMIEETVRQIRSYDFLKSANLIIMLDGVRGEQLEFADDYDEYKLRLKNLCSSDDRFQNCKTIEFSEFYHQGVMTRKTLEIVDTPLIFFCEHDMRPDGEIPFEKIASNMLNYPDSIKVVRLYRDDEMYISHKEMLVSQERTFISGVPLLPTTQWSNNPHIANTDFYRELLAKYCGWKSRTFIEMVVHGAMAVAGKEHWVDWGVWIYAPEKASGNNRRCSYVNGRGDNPCYQMIYAYDNEQPTGTPRPGKY